MTPALDREAVPEPQNPLGIDGLEFIEFATSKPQALGGVLEAMGFRPVARHRSREVELYRQGTMNVIVNAQAADVPRTVQPVERPIISAFALRVRDAEAAFRRALDLGAWAIPPRARAMELNIPAIHGVGESLIYFVDRYDDFSIYDIDFHRLPTVDPVPPAIAGMEFFGIVQYIGADRSADWSEFYRQIFGFTAVPDNVRFGIMPKGHLLRSPCGNFFLQLIEPDETHVSHPRTSICSGSASGLPTSWARWASSLGAASSSSRPGFGALASGWVQARACSWSACGSPASWA